MKHSQSATRLGALAAALATTFAVGGASSALASGPSGYDGDNRTRLSLSSRRTTIDTSGCTAEM